MAPRIEPYPEGTPGIRRSVNEVAQAMRDGRVDEDLRGWAVEALAKRGIDGRRRPAPSIKDQAQALLDELRSQTVYVPDPVAAEWIQKPHVTLCLRDKCIPGGDCDDLTGAFGGACLAIGLQAYAVKVIYPDMNDGTQRQQHILIGLLDENGKNLYADPSSTRPILTLVPYAVEEEWVDPLTMTSTHTGTSGAELALLGRPMTRDLYYKAGHWFEFAHGHWWLYKNGKWLQGPRESRSAGFPGLGAIHQSPDGKWWARAKGGVEVELTDEQAREAGLGTIFEFHTVHELSDLVNALSYQVQQLETGFYAGRVAWAAADPQAAASFQTSLEVAAAAWIPVANKAAGIVNAVKANPQANWDYTLALDGLDDAFDEVGKAFQPFQVLDRTLRASKTFPQDSLPDYSGTPQPGAPDLDLAAYQVADNAKQRIEQFGEAIKEKLDVAAPYIALGAAAVGLYALYRVSEMLPRARSR